MLKTADRQDVMGEKRALLEQVLCCPSCRGPVTRGDAEYRCAPCAQQFPVIHDIPRFLPGLSEHELQVKGSFNLEHSRYLDSRYLHFTPALVDQWLQDIQLPREFFRGKLVLDAGCGSGRWTYAMAQLGAKVVALDLTDSGPEITHKATAEMPNVAVIQASLFNLPFRPESFDLIVSWGVMHHTPDTKAAFDRVAALVKRGGQLYVMVYEKHNGLKYFCTDIVRAYLRSLPEDRRYEACRRLIIKNPLIYRLLAPLIICAPQPRHGEQLDVTTLQLGLYDAYAPVFNYLHTRHEVMSWFQEHNFHDLVLTKPVRYTKKRDMYLFGECGGSVNIRGVRR